MPGTVITNSTNIALLDSLITANLCDGKFYVSVSPSIWIGSGKELVLGANVRITNPYGVIVKPYGPNYEIFPLGSGGMDAVISFNIPTLAGNYQYGQYKIDVQLFDGVNSWVVSKTVSLCEPDSKNKTRSYGSLSAILKGVCLSGRLEVIVDTVPNYKGYEVESQVNAFTLLYPTVSQVDPLSTTYTQFAVQLYEGEYKISGEICATYNMGDNVFAKVKYKVKKEKIIRCILDECCVLSALSDLHLQINAGCTQTEKERLGSITLDALRLLKMAQLSAECGEDPSDYVAELEKLLGCKCTCNCAEGTPIIGTGTSSGNTINIEGCNVSKSTVGLSDIYTIQNYGYEVSIVDNGGALVISSQSLDGCTMRQQITFSIAVVYAQLKTLANQNLTEAQFWASVVNKAINGAIDATCMGISQGTWDGYTLSQRIDAILAKICACCGCSGVASFVEVPVKQGADVLIVWNESGAFHSVDIYLDSVFHGNVLAGVKEYTFAGAADGDDHEFTIIPKCSNGSLGTSYSDEFGFFGCPTIAPADVEPLFDGVSCPFDLEAELPTLAGGLSYEVHNQNNTNNSTLVGDITNLNTGDFYVFVKDTDGCYSISKKVTIICQGATSCTAPQNLQVEEYLTCDFFVSFQSATFPPPSNSYTVKRRLYSDPDVAGSYTTIGTPTYNLSLNRWTICDNTALHNTPYVYLAQSNCGDSPMTTPSIQFTYAFVDCPELTLTPGVNNIDYSFVPLTGTVVMYRVDIYDSTGTVLIHTDTHTAAYSNPTTGSFTYLDANTTYKIRIRILLHDDLDFVECDFVTTATLAA
jgi:hypothetical protein